MFDERLRVVKANVFVPVAQRFSDIPPLQITLLAFVVGLSAALTAGLGYYLVALLLWLANRFLDGLDGEVARLRKEQSDWGGYLDIICDFAIYALLPFALVWSLGSLGTFLAFAFLLLTFYVNAGSWLYLSALLEKRAHSSGYTSIAFPSGFVEGAETIIFYSLFLVFPAFAPYLMLVMALLIIFTIFQRLSWAESNLH
ncbi:MAG: CDP-alcohol phosphatidyltransferase family protein [Trueperaceae bacterium]